MKKTLLSYISLITLFSVISCNNYDPGDVVVVPTNFKISFETNGGTKVDDIIIPLEGDFGEMPESPVKEGEAFAGWYEDEQLTKEFVFYESRFFEEGKLFAKWISASDNEKKFLPAPGNANTVARLNDESKMKTPIVVFPTSIQGNQIKNVGDWACYHDETVVSAIFQSPVEQIGQSSFEGCKSLASVTLPPTLKILKPNAFNGCVNLVNITIPDGLTKIGQGAFANCSKLKRILLSNTLKEIPDWTFLKAGISDSLGLGNSLEVIGNEAFSQAVIGKSVVIPNSVKKIGNKAFYSAARVIIMESTNPDGIILGASAFFHPKGLVIKVPEEALSAYQTSPKWAEYNTNGNVIIPNI